MRTFLTNIIANRLGISASAVSYPSTIYSSSHAELTDQATCAKCHASHQVRSIGCNDQILYIDSSCPLEVLDYEALIQPVYAHADKPKHCDAIIYDHQIGNRKLALCDYTCRPEDQVDDPSTNTHMPHGKRNYAFLQMETTLQTLAQYDPSKSFLNSFNQKVFIFAWREPTLSPTNNKGAQAAYKFVTKMIKANAIWTSYGTTADGFEKIQVKYANHYTW